ncbi:MAG TPA: undecaprenyl-diphosphate phosphatase [Candidatus Blautia gallistercoris]|uniref:Undecaprenyl-diphosphatase n=1 Tax=Candidatus Blautia gallistercoris TaxID=2838490 RepID=A0A9D1WG38_9FIRM|nr:undecaprenyl-diphosphate phosphatase [Candidatus Blautia gallistercoris]
MDFIEILKVIFLGIVEGVTEWLPVSSTGHLILVDEFIHLNMSQEFMNMFQVVIQLGAIMAVVVLYWKKLWPFWIHSREQNLVDRYIDRNKMILWFKIVVACLPTIIIALPFNDTIEEKFNNYVVVSLMLIIYGVLFIVIENYNKHRKPVTDSLDTLKFSTAFWIGCFQVLSVIPGTSRSGATIVGGILVGASRTVAAEFTFFLGIPTMFGASLLKVVKFGFSFTGAEILVLVLGTLTAFVVSVFVIRFLMEYIKKHDFKVFGWYRIVLGILVLGYFAGRSLLA